MAESTTQLTQAALSPTIPLHTSSLSNASILSASDTRLLTPSSLSHRNSFDLRNQIQTSFGKSPVSLSPNNNVLQFDYNIFVTTWQDQIKMRQYDNCEKYCNEVITKLLKAPDDTQKYRSKVHFSLGYLLKKYMKRYDEARDEYFKSIQTDKENPGAHFNLANMLVDHYKDYKLAQIHFEKAIALEPLYALYRMTYAEFLWHDMDKYQDAAAQYEELIAHQNDEECKSDADIHFNYGLLLRDYLKKMDDAAKEFKVVLEINPKDAEAMEEYQYTLSLMNKSVDNNKGSKRKTSSFRRSVHEMGMQKLLQDEEDEYAFKYHEVVDEKNRLMHVVKEKEEYIKKMESMLEKVDRKELQLMVDSGVKYVEGNAKTVHEMLAVVNGVLGKLDALKNDTEAQQNENDE